VVAVISLLVVLVVSLIVVRVASVALSLTGLSDQLARFQARSAFTGAGFTTTESEKVVHHPLRRRIIMLLMLLGNAGIVSAMSSLVLSFVGSDSGGGVTETIWFRITIMIIGLSILWTIASSQFIDRQMSKLIGWALQRFTRLEIRDYAGLLHLSRGYIISEYGVDEDDWMAERTLRETRLSSEGILVLGIEKPDGEYFGAPHGTTKIDVGDTLFLYARRDQLDSLTGRQKGPAGNWEHHRKTEEHKRTEADEDQRQQKREEKAASERKVAGEQEA